MIPPNRFSRDEKTNTVQNRKRCSLNMKQNKKDIKIVCAEPKAVQKDTVKINSSAFSILQITCFKNSAADLPRKQII